MYPTLRQRIARLLAPEAWSWYDRHPTWATASIVIEKSKHRADRVIAEVASNPGLGAVLETHRPAGVIEAPTLRVCGCLRVAPMAAGELFDQWHRAHLEWAIRAWIRGEST